MYVTRRLPREMGVRTDWRVDMLIRSQDKEIIINFDNIRQVRLGGLSGDSIITFADELTITLGMYSTTEKAIKVLDMIQEEYGKHIYGQGGQMATANYYVTPFAFIPPKVFQMPKDDDVK